MSILGTFWFGVRHYANRPTLISCGLVVGFVLTVLVVAKVAGRKNRSSE